MKKHNWRFLENIGDGEAFYVCIDCSAVTVDKITGCCMEHLYNCDEHIAKTMVRRLLGNEKA